MPDISTEQLRTLIRLIAPLRTLRREIEKSIHLELYHGTTTFATKNYDGLWRQIQQIMDDAYIQSLELPLDSGAPDREQAAHLLLAASQLLSYLESYTGVSPSEGKYSIQTAPHIIINTSNTSADHKSRVLAMVDSLVNDTTIDIELNEESDEPEK